jgi:hypothetical protein
MKRNWGFIAKRASGAIIGLFGLGVALLAMRPSPAASVTGHVGVLLLALLPAALAVAIGSILLGRAGAIVVLIAAPVFAWVVLFHPVSDQIPDEDVPKFEEVYSLEERAARGEPFRRMQGHWYQVKPWVSRVLFY